MENQNPLQDIIDMQNSLYTHRLPFNERCAFYAALKLDVSHYVVSLASKLSLQSVGYLAGAGTFMGGQMRYGSVADEYALLGHDAFVAQYLTPVMRNRLRSAAIDQKAGKERTRRGSHIHDAFDRVHTIVNKRNGMKSVVEIREDPDNETKRQWREMEEPDVWRGSFPSGRVCYAFLRLLFAPTEAELESGANERAIEEAYK